MDSREQTGRQNTKRQTYSVTITETLKRTVKVKATSQDEAQEIVQNEWQRGDHVLTADDFKDVHFTAAPHSKIRSYER